MKQHTIRGKYTAIILAAFLVLILAAGCTQKPANPEPPEINYGHDTCDHCRMQIDDPHFASATLLANGDYLIFDDLGEMLVYHSGNPQEQVSAWFVHDYNTEGWLRGEKAFYAHSPTLHTPMGFGIAAFGSQEDAQAFAAEHDGQVYDLEGLIANMPVKMHGSHK